MIKQMEVEIGNKIPTDTEFIKWANSAAALVRKYNWEDVKVYPWNYPIAVSSLINDAYDAPNCSYGSKVQIWSVTRKLTDILNAWEYTEMYGVKVRSLKTGRVSMMDRDIAEELIAEGYAERVE